MEQNSRFINKIICGDAMNLLQELERGSIDLIITSPPYFQCREYGNETVGRENNPIDYVNKFLEFTEPIKKVMKHTGSFYIIIGDVFFGTKGFHRMKKKRKADLHYTSHKICKEDGKVLQHKQLLLLPYRIAIGMQERGWILRNNIVWHKINAMPVYAKDRRLPRHETIFHFVKNKKYYYNHKMSNKINFNKDIIEQSIEAYKKHEATFPLPLIEKLIITTSKKDDVVLDVFAGSGTTAVASIKNDRKFIGFEINEKYVKYARENIYNFIGEKK